MTNRDKYAQLCEKVSLPLHAQAWWMEKTSTGKFWDVIILENAEGEIEAAWPYHIATQWGFRAMLIPLHSQYNYVYINPKASTSIYERLVDALEETCKSLHIGMVQIQGFYPTPLLNALRQRGFAIKDRTTYTIEDIPPYTELPTFFSENKRRQLRKAKNLQLVDLSVEEFYRFQESCWAAQGKKIDYPLSWAQTVLRETVSRQQGRLIAAQTSSGTILASLFLAWDNTSAYFLLPSYAPATKDQGGVAWLTAQALQIAHDKGLHFDFEGSMTPSIASSYQQFGGQPTTYYQFEKYYNPIYRFAIWLHQRL